jgi:hypothetical protein
MNDGVVTIEGWSEGGPPDALIYAGEETTSKSFTMDRPDVAKVYGPLARYWGFKISAIVSTSAIDETKIVLRFSRRGAMDAPLLTYGTPLDSRRIGLALPSDAVFEDACGTLTWFHSVPFGAGRYTPGHKRLDQMNREEQLEISIRSVGQNHARYRVRRWWLECARASARGDICNIGRRAADRE